MSSSARVFQGRKNIIWHQTSLHSMSAQGLTEEQRKKIEENKQRALAKRAGKSIVPSACVTAPSSTCAPKSSNNTVNDRLKVLENRHATFASRPSLNNAQRGALFNNNRATATNSQIASKFYSSTNCRGKGANSSNSISNLNSHRTGHFEKILSLKGKCVLVTCNMFSVDIGFHSGLIEFFKIQKTRSYDPAKKTWSFSLQEYETIMTGLNNFRPEVEVEGFPRYVLEAFRAKGREEGPVPEVDLSSVSSTLVKTLKPFQREGVNIALHRNGRLLLADDMGLGKTLQALCVAAYYREEWPLLIVAPSSVRFDWAQQICKWLPEISRADVNVVQSSRESATSGLVNIISYDLLSKKENELRQRNFKIIIMDESHFLKNYKTIRTKAAMPLLRNARRVLLLSGTPALSRPCELYCQIIAICPNLFKFHDFGLRYCAAKQLPWGWDYSGSSNMLELQMLLEKCVMIRRQKKDVLSQLPPKTRQMVVLDPGSIQKDKNLKTAGKIMDKVKEKGMERRGALLQYFQETGRAKMRAVREYILDLLESDKKLLVFAHHREMLDAIEDCIVSKSNKTGYIRIDGNTLSEQRSNFCQRFQTNEDCKLAILSITAANAGLNLSAATIVVFAELFWNPGFLVQAEDRAHRIGQQDSVSVQYLVAQGTADDYIWPLIQGKLDVLGKAGLSKDDFSEADTKIMTDPSQSSLLDLFNSDFIDTSMPAEDCSQAVVSASELVMGRADGMASVDKRHEMSKQSPSKRQASITNFMDSTSVKRKRLIQENDCGISNEREKRVDDFSLSDDDLVAIESLDWGEQI